MKKVALAVIAVLLMAGLVSGAEIQYFSFEGFAVVNVSVGASKTFDTYYTDVLVASAIISHDPRLGGLIITASWQAQDLAFIADAFVIVTSNTGDSYRSETIEFGPGVYSSEYDSSGTFSIMITKPLPGSSFQIDLFVHVNDVTVSTADQLTVTFDSVRAYFLNDNHQGIESSLTDYTSQTGVLGQALKLDSVEVLMSQINVSTGTVVFDVKWDGTNTVNILKHSTTPVLWIDPTGHVNVQNDAGTVFTSNATLQPLTWQKVIIAFQSETLNGGYIAIDSNQTAINWTGNFIADRVGDSTLTTGTLIDELHIYNEYMTLSEATTGVIRYILKKADGSTIVVSPEGGQELGNISISALDKGGNVLLDTVLSPDNKQVNLPNGTVKVVLSRENIQRSYLVDRVNNIVFPATGTTIAILNVQVNPGTWEYMTVKTADGKIATDVEMSNNMAGFTALFGHQYLFSFQSGNVTRVRTYTVTGSGDIVFYIQDLDTTITPPLDVQAWYEDGLVVVSYYDEQLSTNYLNVTLTGYENFEKAWEVHDEREGSWGLYVIKANANNTDYIDVTIVANVSGEIKTFKHVVYVEGSGESTKAPFPATLVPPALLFLLTALVGIFVFNEPALMLLGGAGSLTLLALMGWIPPAPGLVTVLSLLGVLGLIIYRRG